jgi:hypothetical protein
MDCVKRFTIHGKGTVSGHKYKTGQLVDYFDMANRADECRQKAQQFEHAVTAATDPEAQRTYRQLAQQWREMATHFEAKEQRIPTLRQGVASGIGVGEPND